MRAQIESNVRHVDHAVTRLDEVSRALTTTTTGLSSLEQAVCAAAASIAGTGASAWIMERDGGEMSVRSRGPDAGPDPQLPQRSLADLLAGRISRCAESNHGNGKWSVAIPMTYRQQVSGAMVVSSSEPISDADARALSALANNAAIALENTRLFEGERETMRLMRELDGMKSDFLATAQHEVRTPLTAIVGHIELMRMVWGGGDEEQKAGILDNIELAANQLSDMLETMIDLSLVSADNLRMQRQSVELAMSVHDAIGDVERRFPRGLPVELRVDRQARAASRRRPRATAPGDPLPARQRGEIHRSRGTVQVSAREGERRGRCIIEISDTGIGIDPELHERVFDRFFQADSGGTRSYGGMGVGLALVKVLVEAHGAAVSLSSAAGVGTTVRLDWPCPESGSGFAGGEEHVDLTASRRSQVAF